MEFESFEFYDKNDGINPDSIAAICQEIKSPLSLSEIDDLSTRFAGLYRNPPASWQISLRDLPESYIELLKYSNGGGIENGERDIGFFGGSELREYLLEYQFPDYMPCSLPFGLNGGGAFYVFDMREPESNGEFPILISHSGSIGYEDAVQAAESLHELLTGSENVEDLL